MSEQSVQVVRAAQDAFLAGDVEAALDVLDPDIEWHATVGGIDEGAVYRGRDEVIRAFADYFEVWERMELRADDYIDAGGDDVVVFHHEVARGRESGAVVETDTATIQTVRNGKIVRVRSYMDREQALAVAGVVEPGSGPSQT
jgi:ketosteroid isomerase-like protein